MKGITNYTTARKVIKIRVRVVVFTNVIPHIVMRHDGLIQALCQLTSNKFSLRK
jgi:hypothetical protein